MDNTKRVIGVRESTKMIKDGKVDHAVIAQNTDTELKEELIKLCTGHEVPIDYVSSKEALGASCGIERPAAIVAYLI